MRNWEEEWKRSSGSAGSSCETSRKYNAKAAAVGKGTDAFQSLGGALQRKAGKLDFGSSHRQNVAFDTGGMYVARPTRATKTSAKKSSFQRRGLAAR